MKARFLARGRSKTGVVGGPAAAGTAAEPVVVPVVELETTPRTATSLGDAGGSWLCAWCHNRVANEKDRFLYDGKDEFIFANPEGIRFAILIFSRILGCREVGAPTLEHTWFAGHAWSFCHCDRCGRQLGWYYVGQHQFAGLIKRRIVRALYVNN